MLLDFGDRVRGERIRLQSLENIQYTIVEKGTSMKLASAALSVNEI